jgi:small redox-active disulfide protein 2
MEVKILGSGCPNCKSLDARVRKAVEELKIEDARIEKIEDMSEILKYDVMQIPALIVNGEIKSSGNVPTTEEIKRILAKK